MKTSKRALMPNPHYEEEIALKKEMMKTLLNIESKQNHIESMAEYLELKEKSIRSSLKNSFSTTQVQISRL